MGHSDLVISGSMIETVGELVVWVVVGLTAYATGTWWLVFAGVPVTFFMSQRRASRRAARKAEEERLRQEMSGH